MIFQYQALDRTGKTVSDYHRRPLRGQRAPEGSRPGPLPGKARQAGSRDRDRRPPARKPRSRRSLKRSRRHISLRFGTKQLGLFSRQLATLLKAGLPLPVAITDIVEQIDNKQFRNIIADIKEKIEQGSSFSNALAQHKAVFPDMYISMVRVGESLGSLDHVIARLADLEEKQNILTSKIRSAMYYPAFMLLFAMAVTGFLMTSVIPTIASMFEDQKKELPFVTNMIIGISNFLAHFWYIPLALVIALIYIFHRYKQTTEGRRKIDEMKLKIPHHQQPVQAADRVPLHPEPGRAVKQQGRPDQVLRNRKEDRRATSSSRKKSRKPPKRSGKALPCRIR